MTGILKIVQERRRSTCTRQVDVRGGQCLAATAPCSLKVTYIDPMGRGWCTRHEPDVERKGMLERIKAMEGK